MQRYDFEMGLLVEDSAHGRWVKYAASQATIARLTADRDEARAATAAAYEMAEKVAQAKHDAAMKWASVHVKNFDGKTDSLLIAEEIRALATEAETTALAEIVRKAVDAETRACAEVCDTFDGPVSKSQFVNGQATASQQIRAAILARLNQRKEAGE